MTLEYMQLLKKYPAAYVGNGRYKNPNKSMSIQDIESLEADLCPASKPTFSKAFREFLYLAGRYCSYFAVGIGFESYGDALNAVQIEQNNKMSQVTFPFPFTHIWSFGVEYDADQFYFLDLSEDSDDPYVYLVIIAGRDFLEETDEKYYYYKTRYTFSGYVEKIINDHNKKGYGGFDTDQNGEII